MIALSKLLILSNVLEEGWIASESVPACYIFVDTYIIHFVYLLLLFLQLISYQQLNLIELGIILRLEIVEVGWFCLKEPIIRK